MSRAIVGCGAPSFGTDWAALLPRRDDYHVRTRARLSMTLTAHMVLATSVHQVLADSWLTLLEAVVSARSRCPSQRRADHRQRDRTCAAAVAPRAATSRPRPGATALLGTASAQPARDGIVALDDETQNRRPADPPPPDRLEDAAAPVTAAPAETSFASGERGQPGRRRGASGGQACVWRWSGAARSRRPRGGGAAGSRGSCLSSRGVCERERLRNSAELKQAPNCSGAGNHHEVDVQACGLAGEFDHAVNAA